MMIIALLCTCEPVDPLNAAMCCKPVDPLIIIIALLCEPVDPFKVSPLTRWWCSLHCYVNVSPLTRWMQIYMCCEPDDPLNACMYCQPVDPLIMVTALLCEPVDVLHAHLMMWMCTFTHVWCRSLLIAMSCELLQCQLTRYGVLHCLIACVHVL